MHNNVLKNSSESTINWSICFLCQLHTAEKLQKPSQDGYKAIAENLLQFSELNEIPVDIDISQLDEGGGIEETLLSQGAQCHKSCWLKINNTKL